MNASCIDVLTAKLRSLYLVVVCHVRLIRNDKEKICSPLSHLVDQTARPNLVTLLKVLKSWSLGGRIPKGRRPRFGRGPSRRMGPSRVLEGRCPFLQ